MPGIHPLPSPKALQRIRHVLMCDLHKGMRSVLRVLTRYQPAKGLSCCGDVEGPTSIGPADRGKPRQSTQHRLTVRECGGTASTVASRSRVRPGTLGTHNKESSTNRQPAPPSGRHRLEIHGGDPKAKPVHHDMVGETRPAIDASHVRARAAHVEAKATPEREATCQVGACNDTAGWTTEHCAGPAPLVGERTLEALAGQTAI